MGIEACIPVIPSADLKKSLRLWVDGLEFKMDTEMHAGGKLIFCMLHKGGLTFMLNRRAGSPAKPEDYNGINLYWAPSDIRETRDRLLRLGYQVSELEDRDYGQTEFFLTDDDGFTHCFGIATRK
jgi:uncharacterized glyoxalase superfamily protein PhnB